MPLLIGVIVLCILIGIRRNIRQGTIIAAMLVTVSAWGQNPVQEPAGCGNAPLGKGTVCKLTYPNGNVLQVLADGSQWATVGKVTVQIGVYMGAGPFGSTGNFTTTLIMGRPETDVVNGPKRDKILIQGDCNTKVYMIESGIALGDHDVPMGEFDYTDLADLGQ
jgi:hypothetical protein